MSHVQKLTDLICSHCYTHSVVEMLGVFVAYYRDRQASWNLFTLDRKKARERQREKERERDLVRERPREPQSDEERDGI